MIATVSIRTLLSLRPGESGPVAINQLLNPKPLLLPFTLTPIILVLLIAHVATSVQDMFNFY